MGISPATQPHHPSATGAWVREKRQSLGLTQAALAAIAEMHPTTVHTFESGVVHGLSTDYLWPLLRALQVTPDDLQCLLEMPDERAEWTKIKRPTCPDCGAGIAEGSLRCQKCHFEDRRRSREEMIEALRGWAEHLGRTPRPADARPGKDNPMRVNIREVQRLFGNWGPAIDAAGLETSGRGRPKRGRRLTDDEIADVVRLYHLGMTCPQVASEMDLSASGVYAALKRVGYPTRGVAHSRRLSNKQEADAIRLRNDGMTHAQIAAATGLSTTTLGRILARAGMARSRTKAA